MKIGQRVSCKWGFLIYREGFLISGVGLSTKKAKKFRRFAPESEIWSFSQATLPEKLQVVGGGSRPHPPPFEGGIETTAPRQFP